MVVATGFFDGVHLGHRLAIDRLVQVAKELGDESMVVTFWPHPRNVLQKDASSLRLLTSLREKTRLLKGAGVDHIEIVEFTREFGHLTAEEYLQEYVIGKYGGQAIVLGYDNKFGSDCSGVEEVAAVAKKVGLKVFVGEELADCGEVPSGGADDEKVGGTAISSTRIRTALAMGEVERAATMLGYDYSLHGVVVAGNRLGRTIGFPTANMQLYEPLKLIPGNGVYLVRVRVLHKGFFGMCNVGTRPTVGANNARTVETNIFDFDEDIYGLDIEISFVRKIRDEVRFDSMEDLRDQLSRDRDFCLSLSYR